MQRNNTAVGKSKSATIEEGKSKAVSTSRANKFEKLAERLDVLPGTSRFGLLKFFSENKKVTTVDIKVLIQRTKNLSNEQLRIIKSFCVKRDFSVNNILDSTKFIKKFSLKRLLALRAFVDLDGVTPGALNHFFQTNLPRGEKKTMGYEAWENELKEKMMTHGQINVFYNICNKISDLTPETASAIIPKVRKLKRQHTQLINHFLKEEVFFGEKPINNKNIQGLVNLWLIVPELKNKVRLKAFIKRISRKPDNQKRNFMFIIQSLNEELEKEKRNSVGNIIFIIRNFLD